MAKKPCDCEKMTFQQWAAAGGGVPTSYKGREKAWANQVRKYAEGGDVKMQAGGVARLFRAAKGTQEVLPAAERKANLDKMLEGSKVKDRLYHGTGDDITEFRPSRIGAMGPGTYLTKRPEVASGYSDVTTRRGSANQPNVLPVYAQIKKPFNISNVNKSSEEFFKHFDPSGKLTDDEVIELVKKAGYDAIHALEDGEINVLDPRKIKSAIGNKGTYDTSKPELNEAKGGEVKMAEGGKADKPYIGYRRAGRRPESQQNREAAKNVPVDLARGFISGTLGMPGDIESLARLPYELITGNESPTILPTSGDIEKRLPFKSDSPVSRAATNIGQIGGGFYTGPLSGARAAMAVPKAVMRAGQDFVQSAGQPAVNVIKPAGGNFLTGSVDKAMEPLKRYDLPDLFPELGSPPPNSVANKALNQWIDRNLGNYVRKQMATPGDPVRKLAEEGIVHTPDLRVASYMAPQVRKHYGTEQLGKSQQAKRWEDAADVKISGIKIKDLKPDLREPWMDRADPETLVYHGPMLVGDIDRFAPDLGFDHIVDVLKQDLAAGRIRPEQLSKVSMEQAVRRTYDFDQDMAKKMREAQIKATEGMPVYREYPEGYRWIELAAPKAELQPGHVMGKPSGYPGLHAVIDESTGQSVSIGATPEEALRLYKRKEREAALESALKYEGDTMGHCVGGYCPDVLEGRSRIYSLRDAKGEPHVTIEVNPSSQRVAPRHEEVLAEIKASGVDTRALSESAYDAAYEQALQRVKQNRPPEIKQIKGKQNAAPKEQYLPFVQDFVRGGKWSGVGDIQNTGLYRKGDFIDEFTPDQLDAVGKGEYLTMDEIKTLRQGKPWKPIDTRPDLDINLDDLGMKAGGEVKMQSGGAAAAIKKMLSSSGAAAKEASAAERAAAGRMAADVTKATQPMKMSEALGNLNVEGKGKVKVTQSDRTRVGGGNIGGAMFPGLSQVDPLYQDLVWGVGKKSTGSNLINQSDDLTYWSTLLGSEDQLKSNPIVFNKLRAGFVDAMKHGKLSNELADKINKNLSLTFGEGADIRDPKIWRKADTFEKRTALADVMLGQGIPPGKGGVALGGEKSGKGVIFKPTDILKRETEPLLLHPEHGGDVPTFAVGPRLFQFSGGMKVRPDLHPGFPVLLEGQDMGMVFKPAPGEIAMRDFNQRMLNERGRKPGYYEWTMGESGKGLPSQLITDEYLTYLQKQGYAEGGEVKPGLSALEKV